MKKNKVTKNNIMKFFIANDKDENDITDAILKSHC